MVTCLERDGQVCETASYYDENVDKTQLYDYDIILLDVIAVIYCMGIIFSLAFRIATCLIS